MPKPDTSKRIPRMQDARKQLIKEIKKMQQRLRLLDKIERLQRRLRRLYK